MIRKKYSYYISHILWLSSMVSAIAIPPSSPTDNKKIPLPISEVFKEAFLAALHQYNTVWHAGPYPKMGPFYSQEMKNRDNQETQELDASQDSTTE